MPAVADRAVWENVTKARDGIAGIAQSRKYGRLYEETKILSIERFGGYKTHLKQRIERRESWR